jgi:hypothetical protein
MLAPPFEKRKSISAKSKDREFVIDHVVIEGTNCVPMVA